MSVIDYTQIDDNTPITGNVFNERYGQIIQVINGGIDQSNIKNGSLTRELFSPDAMQAAWPIGSVYISVENVNPGPALGGNWVAFASGRTLVGVDDTQTEFNLVEKTGGHKAIQSHTHPVDPPAVTTSSAGSHAHRMPIYSGINGTRAGGDISGANWPSNATSNHYTTSDGSHTHTVDIPAFTSGEAGSGDSGNLQPYITVYFWKRIS